MKMAAIKQEVYRLTCTSTTQQLKRERSDLTQGKDLRYKDHWLAILTELKALRAAGTELSLTDLAESELMLKESLFTVGRLAGLDDEKLEIDWQRIKLTAQFADLHIEEL